MTTAKPKQPVAMDEHASKNLLKQYGIPVVNEKTATTPAEALQSAEKIGFPVVLKALGKNILHKTEKHLVHLNLATPESVINAADAIVRNTGNGLEGLLVQPHIHATREFAAGFFWDDQFGPVVMFGQGGIYAEALADVAFRTAPLTEADANAMIEEIRSSALLLGHRGEKPVDRAALSQTLMALSRIGLEQSDILEIDINPLAVQPDGRIVTLDSLVVTGERKLRLSKRRSIEPNRLKAFFNPRSVVFVGASAQIGKWGHLLFTSTASGGFSGKMYLVNVKGGEISGLPAFRSVLDIPESVDLGVVTLPAEKVPELIPQFKEKGIRNMLLISSGFSETGPEGKAREKQLLREAESAGILIMGPNTMGFCNPHIKLFTMGSQPRPIAGNVSIVAQSGNLGNQLLAYTEQQGIGVRVFCGSGNEAMVSIEDLMDVFEADPVTQSVILYIESLKNPARFFKTVARMALKKPILMLKGGRSREGLKAAASHSGALASDIRIFESACRQYGILQVENSMDLLDAAAAFSGVPLPEGNRIAILTIGGGWGVVSADLCASHNLILPELPDSIIQKLDKHLPHFWSRSNPVDVVGERGFDIPKTVLEELMKWDDCDGVINLGIVGRRGSIGRLLTSIHKIDPTISKSELDAMMEVFSAAQKDYIHHTVRLMEQYGKPILGVALMTEGNEPTIRRIKGHSYAALFYQTPEQAVKSYAKMVEYQKFISTH